MGWFTTFSDQAQVWVYAFPRLLNANEKAALIRNLEEFIGSWHSHGTPVKGAHCLIEDQFLMLAAEELAGGVSGCSIDSSVRVFKRFQEQFGLDGLNRSLIFYRENDEIHATDRLGFKKLVQAGQVGGETLVFDQTLQTVGELRAGLFEKKFSDSWHSRAFSVPL